MKPNIFKKKYMKLDLLHKSFETNSVIGVDGKKHLINEDEINKRRIRRPNVPEGIMVKCVKCGQAIYNRHLAENNKVCKHCEMHFRLSVDERINLIADEGSFVELFDDLETKNPIDFPEYEEKIKAQIIKTGYKEAITTGKCKINGMDTFICVMNADFMMASMGSVVGEKLTRTFEKATAQRLPVIVYTASGGARMQEGIFSLMQMAKVSGAVARHSKQGLLFISFLTNPTYGGVTASFAMEGDIILAEPGALIGFAGPRVIEQTIRQKLPEGFQTSEFLLEHGFIDAIVNREEQKEKLSNILMLHLKAKVESKPAIMNMVINGLKPFLNIASKKSEKKAKQMLSVWEKVQMARDKERPTAIDYVNELFTNFVEFHGDRYFGDDQAIVGGIAYFKDQAVTVICEQKGRNTKENVERNFGMPNPEGYRKSLRLMKQAEKFKRPVICFVDTPGAYPGLGAEQRGQGEAIAKNLYEMMILKTPIISFIIGEGGSGGALALAVADKVYMLENAIYSILSPEGFATILWKDSKRAKEASRIMKLTAQDLKDYEIIDDIVEESYKGASKDMNNIVASMENYIFDNLKEYKMMDIDVIVERRYDRFRKF